MFHPKIVLVCGFFYKLILLLIVSFQIVNPGWMISTGNLFTCGRGGQGALDRWEEGVRSV